MINKISISQLKVHYIYYLGVQLRSPTVVFARDMNTVSTDNTHTFRVLLITYLFLAEHPKHPLEAQWPEIPIDNAPCESLSVTSV